MVHYTLLFPLAFPLAAVYARGQSVADAPRSSDSFEQWGAKASWTGVNETSVSLSTPLRGELPAMVRPVLHLASVFSPPFEKQGVNSFYLS